MAKVGAAMPRAPPALFSSLYEEEGSQTEVDDEMADGVSIKTLVDHEEDAAFIAQNIQQWLDDEWIPQECHKTIGDKCAEIYIEVRRGRHSEPSAGGFSDVSCTIIYMSAHGMHCIFKEREHPIARTERACYEYECFGHVLSGRQTLL